MQYGQYMTPSPICDFMVEQICHSNKAAVLEPCCGEGAFLDALTSHGFNNLTAYEIDPSIINPKYKIKNQSFISSPASIKYDVIIGNPPYIRWKNLEPNLKQELLENNLWNQNCNSLCDYSSIFILKSIELLKDQGELIFITPEYWLSTTHSQKLRNFMLEKGYISHIFYFNEAPIFKDATVSLVVFRFVKSENKNLKLRVSKLNYKSKKKLFKKNLSEVFCAESDEVESFYIEQFKKDSRWMLCDEKTKKEILHYENACRKPEGQEYFCFGDFFHVGNGMVSGLDKAFQIPEDAELNEAETKAQINVIKAKDISTFRAERKTKYIFLNDKAFLDEEKIKKDFPFFNKRLQALKEALLDRYSYKRTIPFWHWVFLRNYNLFASDKDRIYVPCKERITKRNRFRFCYAEKFTYPTQDVSALFKKEDEGESLYYALALLNSKYVFNWLSYKGVRKGDIIEFSEKPVAAIPFRKIKFEDEEEVRLHDEISTLVKAYIENPEPELLKKVDNLIECLM